MTVERENYSSICWFTAQTPATAVLSQAAALKQVLHSIQAPHLGDRAKDLNIISISCLPGNRKLHQKWQQDPAPGTEEPTHYTMPAHAAVLQLAVLVLLLDHHVGFLREGHVK